MYVIFFLRITAVLHLFAIQVAITLVATFLALFFSFPPSRVFTVFSQMYPRTMRRQLSGPQLPFLGPLAAISKLRCGVAQGERVPRCAGMIR